MKKKFLGVVLASAIIMGCSNSGDIPDVNLAEVTAEKLLDKPSLELMEKTPPKTKLVKGMDDGKIGEIISNNNLRAGTIEWKYEALQQYVCNIFKEPVGEVCKKTN
ncbi:hypothetical protein [Salmonella phage SSBI34]|nr:hypothetical protein [Salmonella phage SSBI34]